MPGEGSEELLEPEKYRFSLLSSMESRESKLSQISVEERPMSYARKTLSNIRKRAKIYMQLVPQQNGEAATQMLKQSKKEQAKSETRFPKLPDSS